MGNRERQLTELLRADERIMTLLRAVRSLGLAEWCIAAGTIRNTVWDELHSFPAPTLPSDVDVLIFDPVRTDPSHERSCAKGWRQRWPKLTVEHLPAEPDEATTNP